MRAGMMTTVDSGRRPMVGDIFDDPDDPIVNVEAGWMRHEYGDEARLEAWLRHCKMAVGRSPKPKRLAQAVKEWPILKTAKEFLTHDEYRALVGTFNPAWRHGLKRGSEEPTLGNSEA